MNETWYVKITLYTEVNHNTTMNHMIADNIEAWMLINGYDNYEVSSVGRVRNNRSGRILGQHDNGHGYLKVVLRGKR